MPDPKPRYIISGEDWETVISALHLLPKDAHLGRAATGLIARLRSAPQAVSLEGVEHLRWTPDGMTPDLDKGFGDYGRFSDLQNLALSVTVDLEALLDAIEAGDEAYTASKIHGQAFWRDCVEGKVSAYLKGASVPVTVEREDLALCMVNADRAEAGLTAVLAMTEIHEPQPYFTSADSILALLAGKKA